MKKCSSCGERKSRDLFYRNVRSSDGLTAACRACMGARGKAYRVTHRDVVLARKRRYRDANKDKIRAYGAQYNRRITVEQRRKHKRQYRLNHPWARTLENNRYRAKKYGVCTGLTQTQWIQRLEEYDHNCAYCGKRERLTIEHIVPLSRGGSHTYENVIPACFWCNSLRVGQAQ